MQQNLTTVTQVTQHGDLTVPHTCMVNMMAPAIFYLRHTSRLALTTWTFKQPSLSQHVFMRRLISHFSLLRTSLNLSQWPNEWRQNSTTSRHHQIQDIVHGAHVIWSRHKCSMFVIMMRCPSIVRWQLNKKHLANLTYSFHYKELKCGIISITILTLYGHIKTAEQQTIIQQYGDKYTGRWWVGCYNWYSPPINSQFISFNVAL